MKLLPKIAIVAGGYIGALLLATAAVVINAAIVNDPNAQASSGMYAFGDTLLFVAVFGPCALLPTGTALFFLRPCRPFWTVLSNFGLVVATTGVTAAILFAVGRHATAAPLKTWVDFSILRMLAAPVLALTFLVCAIFSPQRFSRFVFLAATLVEGAVSAYGGMVWLVPAFLHGP